MAWWIPLAVGAVAGGVSSLLSNNKVQNQNTLTGDQGSYMGQIGQALGGETTGVMKQNLMAPQSAYSQAPNFEDMYQLSYQRPLQYEYQNALRNLQNGPERHSSARLNSEALATNNFMNSLGQARGNMLMQDRQSQMSLQDAALNRQMNYYNILGNQLLGTKGTETIVSQSPNLLQGMMSGMSGGMMLGSYANSQPKEKDTGGPGNG